MALNPSARLALILGAVAVAIPVVLIGHALATTPVPASDPVAATEWRKPPPLSAALSRPLFASAGEEAAALPQDAPDLVGIVGRLDVDAVALVRGRDGAVRTLKPGEGVDGWQLRALAIDAAYFTRGAQQARVALAKEE